MRSRWSVIYLRQHGKGGYFEAGEHNAEHKETPPVKTGGELQ